MDQDTRNKLQRATQQVRQILEEEFAEQLEGRFDVLADGTIAEQPGAHLDATQRLKRQKLVQAISHIESGGKNTQDAIEEYRRQAAFTILNRFVALRMLEARDLLQECVSKGDESSGFKEFCGLAKGLSVLPDGGYRLYLECLCDELTVEIKVLFDRRDPTTLLWPRRSALTAMLEVLAQPELASVWAEDETIGWVYQYFNGDEERTKMRAESQAPRNSRELAVRNQFFTPRYVVQFLTDNTLGRTWYEMMQGDTQLAQLDYLVRRPNEVFLAEGESAPESDANEVGDSELSQEELLQQTVHVPFRAKKDPRDLRILDPACGSGHFLLYTFDLLITIYEEAWADAGAAAFTETATQLRTDYGSIEDLCRAMPALILRHNLHGVDIDPRAAQIAALALWMRAQRAYNQFEVDRAQRPPITKTHIVVAEPMPGDAELVDEFAASLKPAVLGELFKTMVEEMKLAGELGSLLKIEESIETAVKEAEAAHCEEGLFAEKIESQDFWDTADEKIIAALANFAESAAGAGGVRRQLFAGDAAQGVAFIELMRKRFDAVLMNPPFGAGSQRGKRYFESLYPLTKNDIFAAFTERGILLLTSFGRVGAITSRTGFFLGSFQSWREKIIGPKAPPTVVADLGHGVLDAMVEVAAYCLGKTEYKTTYIRLLDAVNKSTSLKAELAATSRKERTYVYKCSEFSVVPGSPHAYWVSDEIRHTFKALPGLGHGEQIAKVGLQTGDDFRFVRIWTEVPPGQLGPIWSPFAKGGAYSPYYSDHFLVVNWQQDGREIRNFAKPGSDRIASRPQNTEYYFRPGITWSDRTTKLFSARIWPAGGVFSVKGSAGFFPNDPFFALGLLNSIPFNLFLSLMVGAGDAAARSYQVGTINKVPFPDVDELVSSLARRGWELRREPSRSDEMSHVFEMPAIVREPKGSLPERITRVDRHAAETHAEVREILDRINTRIFDIYGINESERTEILTELGGDDLRQDLPLKGVEQAEHIHELFSWLVGVISGRFAVTPSVVDGVEEISPFDVLPKRSPGMRPIEKHLALSHDKSRSASSFPEDGSFVDDRGHNRDFVACCRAVFEQVFDEPKARWNEAAELLGSRNQDLRLWFANDFFSDHIKQYSKSRRKAPIYWQLATPSASYSVWCYYHRLTRDTFFRVANDYVTPKVDHEERKLNTLRQEAGPDPSSKQRKAIDVQETFVAELRAFLTEVTRIAPLWKPNLNDGVIINFAPLWRLVPQHKAWQKECKKVWDKLCKGDYDWAHLAMHLWPERVVPKCQEDRSLAIAHGLEDDFWYEDDKEKWQKREPPEGGWEPVLKKLIDERTSLEVKAALESLLEAPAPAAKSNRRRKKAKTN